MIKKIVASIPIARAIYGMRFFVNQKNFTPLRNPINSGGSPKGLAAPPILLIMMMKKITKCVRYFRCELLRKKGRSNSIEAPVVPIHPARNDPPISKTVLPKGPVSFGKAM